MRRRRRAADRAAPAAPALLLALLMALAPVAACGSRLPERDFTRGTGAPAPTDPASGAPAPTAAASEPVKVGIIASATSPVGAAAFTGPRDGARAYFARLNAAGGLAGGPGRPGRPIQAVTCDDGGSGVGNNDCVRRLVEQERVVALVATTALDYAGAPRVSAAGVPDIGGQPIGAAYDTYPGLYGIYGSLAPRDGEPGWDGRLYGGTEVYRYFKRAQGARSAAVVSYNQAASASYARLVTRGLQAEGYDVVGEQVDFALPNFRAVAADLRARGTDLVFDALDTHGNAQLCAAMDAAGVKVTAKVTNVQNWNATVREDYKGAPGCRNALWATGSSRNYDSAEAADSTDSTEAADSTDSTEAADSTGSTDSAKAADGTAAREVRAFRAGMQRYARQTPLSQWALEGWAAAMWFADAATSCSGDVTRDCVQRFMERRTPYTARGLLLPVSYERLAEPPASRRTCLSVARWRDGAGGGAGRWVTEGGDMIHNCFTVPLLAYRP